jgi:hypothetical protein
MRGIRNANKHGIFARIFYRPLDFFGDVSLKIPYIFLHQTCFYGGISKELHMIIIISAYRN